MCANWDFISSEGTWSMMLGLVQSVIVCSKMNKSGHYLSTLEVPLECIGITSKSILIERERVVRNFCTILIVGANQVNICFIVQKLKMGSYPLFNIFPNQLCGLFFWWYLSKPTLWIVSLLILVKTNFADRFIVDTCPKILWTVSLLLLYFGSWYPSNWHH